MPVTVTNIYRFGECSVGKKSSKQGEQIIKLLFNAWTSDVQHREKECRVRYLCSGHFEEWYPNLLERQDHLREKMQKNLRGTTANDLILSRVTPNSHLFDCIAN